MDDEGNPELTRRLKEEARRLGFDGVGIAPAVPPPGHGHYLEWLAQGNQAGMDYLERACRRCPTRTGPALTG